MLTIIALLVAAYIIGAFAFSERSADGKRKIAWGWPALLWRWQ